MANNKNTISLLGSKEFLEGEKYLIILLILVMIVFAFFEGVGIGLIAPLLESSMNSKSMSGMPLIGHFLRKILNGGMNGILCNAVQLTGGLIENQQDTAA